MITLIIIIIILIIISKYIYYQTINRIHDELYKLMSIIHNLFEKYDINYFIISGTLLGSVRDKKIIEHDDDIDIGILEDQFKIIETEEFINDMNFYGIKLTRHGDNIETDTLYKFSFIEKNYGSNIDLFIYTIDTDNMINFKYSKWRKEYKHEYFNYPELFPIQKNYKLNDLWLNGPRNPYSYLSRTYGNWKVPKITKCHMNQFNINIVAKILCYIFVIVNIIWNFLKKCFYKLKLFKGIGDDE